MRAKVTIEIQIKDNITDLYPNFIFNYKDKQDFLINHIASLNHNLTIEEQEVYKNYHPHYDNPNYKIHDDGYKQKVTNVNIESSKTVQATRDNLYQIIVLCDNELESLIQHLTKEEMIEKYIELCNKWYSFDALEKFKNNCSKEDSDIVEMYDSYKSSDCYFDADDRANVIWELM